jgi:hypothetical protein
MIKSVKEVEDAMVESVVQVLHPNGNQYFIAQTRGEVQPAYSRKVRTAAFVKVYGRNPENDVELFSNTPIMFTPGVLELE